MVGSGRRPFYGEGPHPIAPLVIEQYRIERKFGKEGEKTFIKPVDAGRLRAYLLRSRRPD